MLNTSNRIHLNIKITIIIPIAKVTIFALNKKP